ncbi:midasin [Episyrphus balteatus]|uniref:midasin n=1 Tax=Episyrphus balteatus TaxID=286459 RepID=UPI002484DAF5|nr:midasin [Episyrphus balteatus]
MEISSNKFKNSINNLLNLLKSEDKFLKEFLRLPDLTAPDVLKVLTYLGSKLLDPQYTENIGIAFQDCLLLIVTERINNDDDASKNFEEYQKKCIALSKLMKVSKDVLRYATKYLTNKPAPFKRANDENSIKKKAKLSHSSSVNDLEIAKCCYRMLSCDPVFFKDLWNWSQFVSHYLNQGCDLQKLYCNHAIAIITHMTPHQLKELNKSISEDVVLLFHKEQHQVPFISSPTANETPNSNKTDSLISVPFASEVVTNVEGVLLPIFNNENKKFYEETDGNYDSIVRVDSTKVNLRSIALGVSSGKAICLSGPVGCGKTTLVEYLARQTGRVCPKKLEIENLKNKNENKGLKSKGKNGNTKKEQRNGNKRKSDVEKDENVLKVSDEVLDKRNGFLRIQLGDQTDSKMLLGQYRCTDVPGEFIWLPGVLTQAVMNGYWLLLEDLDSATQDTYTILNNLLENNFLSVPGFRDCVKIEPGFQLFVTIRTNKGANASQKCLYSLLEKYLYTINVLPLSRNELCRVVSTNYPKLSTVANRIVDVFLTFSSGDHTIADNLRTQETHDKADTTEKYIALPFEAVSVSNITNSGRLVSTRDLIKLCARSNPMFSVTSTECAYFVFQNAVDVFCSYLPEGRDKTRLVTSIGAKLGIIQSRCEFFADEYKPDVEVDSKRIKVGRAELVSKSIGYLKSRPHDNDEDDLLRPVKKQKLAKNVGKIIMPQKTTKSATFSFTRMASCLLERIAVCVGQDEPVLLVGETGVGKTSSVQYLAEKTHHKLVVVNMNNQSDVSDLVGGFKPVDLNYVIAPLRSEFENLFRKTFDGSKNETFLNKFSICYNQGNFKVLIKLMITVVGTVFTRYQKGEFKFEEDLPNWKQLQIKLQKLDSQLTKSINISFAFIPGSLVNCIKNGDWVLLDEINLASAETLECLSTILEPDGSVVLLEKGDFTPVKRHPDFRIFACMNPSTDIGKKDLPVGIRNRFTEFFVDELTTEGDLTLLVSDYLSNTGIEKKRVTGIVKMYKKLRILSKLELNDGLGNRPVFSLRTLCRSLRICAKNLCGSIERNLYESFCMSFLTQLDPPSHNIVLELIKGSLLSNVKAVLSQGIPRPGEDYLNFESYWIQKGPNEIQECSNYILTKSVGENLKDLARIISIGKLPILLQGPTSAGKTSLIEYVAKKSGNHCLRINNHEHTDLQEYIGTYTSDVTGKLSFKEGVLVQAMRNGFWIILDELNLASTDILEALNRVLDDNRELFIPETQTVVKAHPNFMLFATQNPPGLYGGRKTLSRAFKNRFIELHFSEIPRNELEVILEKRCLIPQSYSKKMVQCMWDLQKNRKTTTKNVFTLRDLFRWGNRYTFADKQLLDDLKYDWNQHLIEEGYLVLSAKVRTDIEIEIIEETLYRNFRKKINLDLLFGDEASPVTRNIIDSIKTYTERNDIVWTRNMTRMAVLAAKAIQFNEPVLLVGPTGCGKTTVCQILASIHDVQLRILNCHMHTEGADFLGGLRPCRTNSENDESQKLFEWADGPLIMSMVEGSYFMADEISLAEDSVLERLNCILEPERTVLLAEKGGVSDVDSVSKDFVIKAADGFQFFATMNPGGDFGKKELSPALRNRFTEIWCIPSDSRDDLINIAANCMAQCMTGREMEYVRKVASFLVDVVFYIRDNVEKFKFSIRDILAWSNYLIVNSSLEFPEAAVFGLETIFLDSLEMLPHESLEKVEQLKLNIIRYAIEQAKLTVGVIFKEEEIISKRGDIIESTETTFGIKPFFIPTNPERKINADEHFLFDAPTTKKNLFRLLSALSLSKPVLLEGPPGVGKTSIVESLAHAIGYNVVRINLCEHTDLADLFGTDLPAEDNIDDPESKNTIGSFVWRDGPLLAALKSENTWILLDELNLAPQSVLEGLNAILDHRGEVYIPELNKTFVLSRKTRIFACQNPLRQGGGRKGLPQSFLNRFNKVYLRKLTTDDLLFVVNGKYAKHFEELAGHFTGFLKQIDGATEPFNLFDLLKQKDNLKISSETHPAKIEFDLSLRLVKFSEKLDKGIADMEFGYKGGPFEINLRDIMRWCDLLISPETGFIPKKTPFYYQRQQSIKQLFNEFENFLVVLYERMKLIYYQRMRSDQDKIFIRNAFSEIFNCDADKLNALSEDVALYWTDTKVYLNDIVLEREPAADSMGALRPLKSKVNTPLLLASQREYLKNLIECVYMEKPVLLCGPTDSGKTKLIDLVCTLSNEVCNSDTIDDSVTGSFQQIDLNRHLEEISQNVEAIFITEVQNLILELNNTSVNGGHHQPLTTHKLVDLLNAWSKYSDLNKIKIDLHNQSEMADELNNFRNRIQLISKVITNLLSVNSISIQVKSELEQLSKVLKALKNLIRNYESLNTGGSFEWVDSKIVKSLKNGQYISLEHVNLCSSAVLDRLNPVFEPNGKLLISEKGVTANDEAEIVDKHDNFRAFLTIDPKNGELSRAMRNRCVEMAFSKDNYTKDDLRVIVYESGISNMNSVNTILTIHERICQATEINNFNVSHLTQFAFLVKAYKCIGYDDEKAIYVSGMEVYVYSSNTDLMGYGLAYYQNQLREIVLEESKKLNLSEAVKVDLQNVVLRGEDLNTVALVKMQAEPFRLLLNNDSAECLSQLFSSFENLEFENSLELIKTVMYMLYETSSMDDSNLRHLYFKEILSNNSEGDKNLVKQLEVLNNELYSTIHQSRHNFGEDISSLPWNSKLFPRIREYIAELNADDEQQGYALSALLLSHLLVDKVGLEPVTKLSQINSLAYSQAVQGKVINDRLNNVFLNNLATFVKSLGQILNASLGYAGFNLSTYVQVVTAFLWTNRLLKISKEKLFIGKVLNTNLMDKLLLHFKWLDKNLLKQLEKLLPNYKQLNPDFESSLQKITNYALSVNHPLNLIRKVYTKQITQFQPYYSDEQVQRLTLRNKLDASLAIVPVYGSFTNELIAKKLLAQKSVEVGKLRAAILKKKAFDIQCHRLPGGSGTPSEIPKSLLDAMTNFINDFADKPEEEVINDWDMEDHEKSLAAIATILNVELHPTQLPNQVEFEMLPLREYFVNKFVSQIMANKSRSIELNEFFIENISTLSTSSLELLQLTKNKKYQQLEGLFSEILNYISTIETDGEFESLIQYLNVNFRLISTYNHLVTKACHSFMLNNLSTRSDACLNLEKTDLEVASTYTYTGPPLSESVLKMLFHWDGSFKAIPLNNLQTWKSSLADMRQLVWNNGLLMTKRFDLSQSILEESLTKAKKLCVEVKYVQKLCQNMENENFSDYNDNFQKLVSKLKVQCSKTQTEINAQLQPMLKSHNNFYNASLIQSLIGTIELCLLTFTPLIDPVEKNRLKKEYIVEDINCLTTLMTAYDFMKITMNYKNFGSEICNEIQSRLADLAKRQDKFSQKVALRPEVCLYSNLVQDITHFLKTNCEPNAMHSLLQLVDDSWQDCVDFKPSPDESKLLRLNETYKKLDLWISNSQRFINHTMKRYAGHYEDFLQPLECSVGLVRFGFEGLKVSLQQLQSSIVPNSIGIFSNLNENAKLGNLLTNIVEFPSASSLQVFNVDRSKDMHENRSIVFSVLDRLEGSEFEYFRLLKSKILELKNRITISLDINEETFNELDFALNICNKVWQDEEERKRKQKAEEDSLYVTKTKCETEDEELIELQEIEENFPTNVEEDFGEFIVDDSLEKVMKLSSNKKITNKSHLVIRDEDYGFLAQNFITLMEDFSKVYYYHPDIGTKNKPSLDFISPFKDRVKVFVKLFSKYKTALNEQMDKNIYNTFAFAIGLQQEMLNEVSFSNKNSQEYNFYKDSNIPEIISCTDVMDRIEKRVMDQLELYPEHASLIDIIRVIKKIRSLPSTSPVVRFNTGFQILRQKVAQWNEVAHKNNHLRDLEVQVAEFVQKWTKLELQFWRTCLSQTYERVQSNAYKYWFFIYNLLQEYIQDHEIDSSYTDIKYTEKRFAEGETMEVEQQQTTKISPNDILRILKQFVESSSYGDFQVRMDLLKSFELYLHYVQIGDEEKKTTLIAGLHNLQIYFSQFTAEIEEHKKSVRGPIEKKLKEFVKIESYNKDLSYFSMRSNVARVHRSLNKFLKEYQNQLIQKITPVFQPKDATAKDYNFINEKGRDLRYDPKIKYYMVDVKAFVAPQKLKEKFEIEAAAGGGDESSLLHKVGKLFLTSRNVVKETISNVGYPSLINALDELMTTQIETCDYLRNLEVDRSQERPKQVIEAKHILQQKRKALSDFFKTLANLGLSYKSGLLEMSLRTEFEDLALPPFCVKTMLGGFKDKKIHPNIVHLNENLDRYYAKCVFKLKLLQNAMLAPLSELGPPNIDRIKGFAVETFLLVQNQRVLLSNSTRHVYELQTVISNLKLLSEMDNQDPNGLKFSKWRDEFVALKESICKVRLLMEQFVLLLKCVPDKESSENTLLVDTNTILIQGELKFSAITDRCNKLLGHVKSLLNDMAKNDVEFLSNKRMESYNKAYLDTRVQIEEIRALFSVSEDEYLPAAKSLTELLHHMEEVKQSFEEQENPTEDVSDFENIDIELENIVHSILLSIQKLFKKYPKQTITTEDGKEQRVSPSKKLAEDEQIKENHLKGKLHQELLADWEILNLSHVTKKMSNILLSIKHSKGAGFEYIQKITSILPILEQYNLVADYYLFQQLGAHKVSAKMLSIMLTVFVELSTKGFCVPADLMQDEEGESKKNDEKKGEGFGLEDGTGDKDASDKIESEDQLDDAKRPEDRKEEDKKNNEDCKEEKGIEMSDDFEGKMQDIEKEEDDSGESEDEEDLNKEMGDTDKGADKLDDQIWGSDEEEQEQSEDEKEMEEEDEGKGSKDESDAHNDLDTKNESKQGEEEHDKDGLDATDDQAPDKEKKKQEKDIDEMKEPEFDEEQTNPYHNQLEEPPEAEEMDLGDNVNMDDERDADDQRDDDNPFDIDTMKEQMQQPEKEEGDEEEGEGDKDEPGDDENKNEGDSSDSEEEPEAGTEDLKKDKNGEEEKKEEEENVESEEAETKTRGELDEEEQKQEQEEDENKESTAEDKDTEAAEESKDKQSKEDNVQSVPENENKGSTDQVQNEDAEKDINQDQKLDEQDTGDDKDGVGQAENEASDQGHQGVAETKETETKAEQSKEKTKPEEKRKQGRTNEERTLGEAEENKFKQLKTIDKMKEQKEQGSEENDDKQDEAESEEFQHVKDPKNNDKITLDNATEEQSKQIKHLEDEEKKDDEEDKGDAENTDELMDVDETPNQDEMDQDVPEISAEKLDSKSDKPSKTEKNKDQSEETENIEVEGDVVDTMTVPRGDDTTAHCQKEILMDTSIAQDLTAAETLELRKAYQNQLISGKGNLPQHQDYEMWQIISNKMLPNARELCEQLRLILEPTKCTRLKGDYRTGRRINMKKIIPYIASQFRKDKIWLRRTKPAQRDYKITIAIDDSKSMDHNNSKELTLEAISLVSQALTLLESGRLSIVSFGEAPKIILNHTEQFDGPRLVSSLAFAQEKTNIADLLDFVRTVNTEEGAMGSDNGLFENLLLVLSDGRNIFSEGNVKVRNAVKLARRQRIFLVYIIIDNPENKSSILDIQSVQMLPDKKLSIKSYLDDFPFPYYMIVRDLGQLPLVLSEAMRQWFELVNSEQ